MDAKETEKLKRDAKEERKKAIDKANTEYRDTIAAIEKVSRFAAAHADQEVRVQENGIRPKCRLKFSKQSVSNLSQPDSVALAVREVIKVLEPEKVFSIRTVLKKIPEKYPSMVSVSRHTIATALRRVAETETALIEIVSRGAGRRPTKYKRKGEKNAHAATG